MRISLLLVLLVVASGMPLGAEQPDTAADIYGLTGGYRFGNKSHNLPPSRWDAPPS